MNTLKSIPSGRFWSVACAALACVLCVAQVPAGEPGPRSVTVSFRDLDLTTVTGARTLYQRLKNAAQSVCDQPRIGIEGYRVWHACYDTALSDAVAKVNSPLLIAMHRGHGKVPDTATAMLSK